MTQQCEALRRNGVGVGCAGDSSSQGVYCGRFHLGQVGLYGRVLLDSPRLVLLAKVLAGSELLDVGVLQPRKERTFERRWKICQASAGEEDLL